TAAPAASTRRYRRSYQSPGRTDASAKAWSYSPRCYTKVRHHNGLWRLEKALKYLYISYAFSSDCITNATFRSYSCRSADALAGQPASTEPLAGCAVDGRSGGRNHLCGAPCTKNCPTVLGHASFCRRTAASRLDGDLSPPRCARYRHHIAAGGAAHGAGTGLP